MQNVILTVYNRRGDTPPPRPAEAIINMVYALSLAMFMSKFHLFIYGHFFV